MKGIVFTGERAEVTHELEVRDPGPTEVKVQIVAAGVCHSDVSVINGTIPWPAPSVLGHEGAGIVAEVGSAVTSVRSGDHVVIATLASCGKCKYCNTGKPTWCRSSLANISQPFTYKGQPASNFAATSVFADYVVVQEIQAVKIADDVPLTSACLISCGVLTGVGTVFNRANVQLGQSAAVFGAGGVGLNVIQALRIKGARRIIAVDTEPAKEVLARKFGATDFLDARGIDAVAAIRDLEPHQPGVGFGPFNAGGVDWAFDCVGHPQVTYNAVESLDWGGTCVIIGVPAPDVELHAIITRLVQVDRGIIGCRYGSNRPHYDVPLMIDLYRRGELMLDELVSATYPLEEFDMVVQDMHEGKLARGVLTL